MFENKKIIIIAVTAIAVLGIGIFTGYNLLNKDRDRELPVVKEDNIPDYDRSKVIEASPEDKGIDVSDVERPELTEEDEAAINESEKLKEEFTDKEWKDNAVTVPEKTDGITILEAVVKNNEDLAKLKEQTKDIVIVEKPKEPINNDNVVIETEKATKEQLMAALNTALDDVSNKKGPYYDYVFEGGSRFEGWSEEKLMQDIDKIKNNFDSSKHLVEIYKSSSSFESDFAKELFVSDIMDWLATNGDEGWKSVEIN